jgi:CRP/FNR family cyclic AMP-dependent transcriptional regulator
MVSKDAGQRGTVRLFAADLDLLNNVSPAERHLLPRDPIARVIRLDPGAWRPPDALVGKNIFGVLVIEGLIGRRTEFRTRFGLELLGPHDLFHLSVGRPTTLTHQVTWTVLQPTRLAVMTNQLVTQLTASPAILCELVSRFMDRPGSLGLQLALANVHPLPDRLWGLLWHLADRWGKRRNHAVRLPGPLKHAVLAELIGAQRPPVSSALRVLQQRGVLSRDANGDWLLHMETAPGAPAP